MAPEQTTGEPLDRRVDLFAIGIVLWELLAGRRLFHGQTDGEVIRALLVNPIPSLRDFWPDAPEPLVAVTTRALQREKEKRFANAAQFADGLTDASGSIGVASARAVASYVREVARPRVDEVRARTRAVLGESDAIAAPAPTRARENSDPEKTIPRAAVDSTGVGDADGPTHVRMAAISVPPSIVLDGPAVGAPPLLRARASSIPPAAATGGWLAQPSRRRAVIAVVVITALLAMIGAFVVVKMTTTSDASPQASASSPTSAGGGLSPSPPPLAVQPVPAPRAVEFVPTVDAQRMGDAGFVEAPSAASGAQSGSVNTRTGPSPGGNTRRPNARRAGGTHDSTPAASSGNQPYNPESM